MTSLDAASGGPKLRSGLDIFFQHRYGVTASPPPAVASSSSGPVVSPPSAARLYFCTLCQRECSTRTNLIQHQAGQKHQKRLLTQKIEAEDAPVLTLPGPGTGRQRMINKVKIFYPDYHNYIRAVRLDQRQNEDPVTPTADSAPNRKLFNVEMCNWVRRLRSFNETVLQNPEIQVLSDEEIRLRVRPLRKSPSEAKNIVRTFELKGTDPQASDASSPSAEQRESSVCTPELDPQSVNPPQRAGTGPLKGIVGDAPDDQIWCSLDRWKTIMAVEDSLLSITAKKAKLDVHLQETEQLLSEMIRSMMASRETTSIVRWIC